MTRTICWAPLWSRAGAGLEHLQLSARSADSVLLAIDDERGPFRLAYRLTWDEAWRLRRAELNVAVCEERRSLVLETDGRGRWRRGDGTGSDPGLSLPELEGCIDIDIWPTPFTNSFPIRRSPLAIGERREFLMAWVSAPELSVKPQPQAYTRLAERRYRFDNLDGSGFSVELAVDEDGVVLDYPDLFRRLAI